jgi:flagellar basal-body rod protein FlgC
MRREIMITPLNSSVSAINAVFKIQAVSAHNIANSNTDGFKSSVASTQENQNGSVTVTVNQNTEPGAVYYKGDGTEAETSNVDYAREAVNQINARTQLAANIAALKTQDDMYRSVIDIMA